MRVNLYITFKNSNIHVNVTDKINKTLWSTSRNAKSQILFKEKFSPSSFSIEENTFFTGNLIKNINSFFIKYQVKKVFIIISGFHIKRSMFLKSLFNMLCSHGGLEVNRIFYVSKKPYNGCRKKKQRRLLLWLIGRCLSGLKF